MEYPHNNNNHTNLNPEPCRLWRAVSSLVSAYCSWNILTILIIILTLTLNLVDCGAQWAAWWPHPAHGISSRSSSHLPTCAPAWTANILKKSTLFSSVVDPKDRVRIQINLSGYGFGFYWKIVCLIQNATSFAFNCIIECKKTIKKNLVQFNVLSESTIICTEILVPGYKAVSESLLLIKFRVGSSDKFRIGSNSDQQHWYLVCM
jgi:hypothetical protein